MHKSVDDMRGMHLYIHITAAAAPIEALVWQLPKKQRLISEMPRGSLKIGTKHQKG